MTSPDLALADDAPAGPDERRIRAGLLRLGIRAREGRSYAADQFHQGALRVLRPHYLDHSGQVTYTIVNPGGAYFGADEYEIDVRVDEGASVLLTTQSATKVYRTPQGAAGQQTTVDLAADAVMESLPDQVILYREGSYRQRTLVTMHPRATYVAAEVVTPGWSPDGGHFRYDELRMRTQIDVVVDGSPRVFAVDQLRLVPDPTTRGLGVMEGHSHLGQLIVADRRVDGALVDQVAELLGATGAMGITAGVSRIGAVGGTEDRDVGLSGLAVRSLGHSTQALMELNHAVVDVLRDRWRGQPPLDLRKY